MKLESNEDCKGGSYEGESHQDLELQTSGQNVQSKVVRNNNSGPCAHLLTVLFYNGG